MEIGVPGCGRCCALKNDPTLKELKDRVERADDIACNGGFQDGDCPCCKLVVEELSGGDIWCPECGHVNAIGHDCADWKAYDEARRRRAEASAEA